MKENDVTEEQRQLIEEFADEPNIESFNKLLNTYPENTNYLGLYIFMLFYKELKDEMTKELIIESLTMVIDKMNKENDKSNRKDSEQVGI